MKGFYFPVEEAILADWMGVPRPGQARGIRVDHPGTLRALAAVFPRAIRPRRQADGTFGRYTLASAAGRVALAAVPQRLVVAAAPPVLGEPPREHATEVEQRPRPPRPLLEVDWAPSAGQPFQPEAYDLCDLPGFGARVVVATRDSAEAYGYGVVAVGWFHADAPILEATADVLMAWWRRRADEGHGPWTAILATGLVRDEAATAWAGRVWGERPQARRDAG